MTIKEAMTVRPNKTKVLIKRTRKVLMVRLLQTARCAKTNTIQYILLKCDDGTWYTNEEVELA